MKSTRGTDDYKAELEKAVETIRADLKLSFWQGVSVALFIFVLSLLVILVTGR